MANLSEIDFPELKAARLVAAYGNLVPVIIGVPFNAWAMYILAFSKELRKLNINTVILVKTLMDTLYEICYMLFWSLEALDEQFNDYCPQLICKLRYTFGVMAIMTQPYCVLLSSLDRTVAVLAAVRYKDIVTKRRLTAALAACLLPISAFAVVQFLATGITDHQCWLAPGYERFWSDVRTAVLLFGGSVVPVTVICLLNAAIVLGWRRVGRVVTPPGAVLSAAETHRLLRHAALQRSVTITLCTEAAGFILAGFPSLVANVFYRMAQMTVAQYPAFYARTNLAFRLASLLGGIAMATNFFIYYFGFPQFRARAQASVAAVRRTLFLCKRLPPDRSTSTNRAQLATVSPL